MRYIKPEYYDDFACIADRCPDTCCAGWQIVIDEESLTRYEAEAERGQDIFSKRLETSIDWQEGVFCQKEKRCAFLNAENLCDLYTKLGADGLCKTCREYPRHTEEFEGLRELSLSLSCPVAAEMILRQEHFPNFQEYETDEPEELWEEFEDFDLLLFTQLEDARRIIFTILKESDQPLIQKMKWVLSFSKELDDCVGDGDFARMDEIIKGAQLRKVEWEFGDCLLERYQMLEENFQVLEEMELLRADWLEKRDAARKILYDQGFEHYKELVERFDMQYEINGVEGIPISRIAENLFVTFVYTWFCGAVYNGWVYSKMAMAAFCTFYILEFILAEWVQKGEQLAFADCVELTWRFTREVEHSEENLSILEDWFIKESPDAPEEF